MSTDSEDPEPRPWILLVLAAVLVLIGLDNLNSPDGRDLAVGGLFFGAFCVALFFLPDLRDFMSRWPR